MSNFPAGKVVAGDYKSKQLWTSNPIVAMAKVYVKWGAEKIYLNSENVDKYEVINDGETKSKVGLGLAVVGIGKINQERSGIQVKIWWKDGKKSLLEVNEAMISILNRELF